MAKEKAKEVYDKAADKAKAKIQDLKDKKEDNA